MRTIELSAGTLEYVDTGGPGPVVVLLHGLLMDESLWTEVIDDLSSDHRCIAPTLPLGGHRVAMNERADLSLPGVAGIVAELMERLDLHDVVLIGNDTGGAIVQLLATKRTERLAGIVLVSCDAFDNYPPGLTGKALVLSGKLAPRLFGSLGRRIVDHELRGVPLRIELGPRELALGQALVARRVRSSKETATLRDLARRVPRMLDDDQQELVHQASALRDARTLRAKTLADAGEIASDDFARIPWRGCGPTARIGWLGRESRCAACFGPTTGRSTTPTTRALRRCSHAPTDRAPGRTSSLDRLTC